MSKVFTIIPWAGLVCAVWAIIRLNQSQVLDFNTPAGIALLFFAFIALVIEFFKSGDVGLGAFIWDLTFALLTLGFGVYTITLLDQRNDWNILDVLIFAVLVCDAWVSPINAFRTALRNFDHSQH
jgi:hypothetical protein